MPLLTPEKAKTDSSSQEEEQRARVRDMSQEEERLVASINILRKEESDTKSEVRESVAKYRNDAQTEVHALTIEVTNLENRRAEAMKPIQQVQQEVDERNASSHTREEALIIREAATTALEKDLNSREAAFLEEAADTKQLQGERDEGLDKREDRIRQEEERSRESLDGLKKRWESFHAAVAEKELELTTRENVVSAGEQANLIRASELRSQALAQTERERGIIDGYATLASAQREAEDKETIFSN